MIAIEKFTRVETFAAERSKYIGDRTPGETVKQDRLPADGHAQRRRAIIVRRAAAHALRAPPSAAEAFDDLARTAFEPGMMRHTRHGRSFDAAMPIPVQPPLCPHA
jgi:hypothetical protein